MLQFLYSLACVLIPVIIYQRKLAKTAAAEGTSPGTAHYVWVGVFLLYIWLAMFVAGFGSLWELFFDPDGFHPDVNVVPFASFDIINGILNAIMFLPLGFLLPLIWKNYRSLGKIALTGLLFSFIIELSQLTNNRAADINDLMMNTLGAVLGGLAIGLVETLWGQYFSADYKDVAAFSLLAVTLLFMPSGFLGRPDVEKV